jgi:hypothetical protein
MTKVCVLSRRVGATSWAATDPETASGRARARIHKKAWGSHERDPFRRIQAIKSSIMQAQRQNEGDFSFSKSSKLLLAPGQGSGTVRNGCFLPLRLRWWSALGIELEEVLEGSHHWLLRPWEPLSLGSTC